MRRIESVWKAIANAVPSGRTLPVAAALAVSLAATVTVRSDDAAPVVGMASTPAAAVPATDPSPAVTAAGMQSAEPTENAIDAVVALAAHKYRVAEHAVRDFVATAFAEARRNHLDPLLVVAVIAVESRFNPVAQSEFGGTGLMQVIPRFHRDKFSAAKGETVLDPRINIRVGTLALRQYVALGGTETAGLQLYNGAADDPDRSYARKVLAERAHLREAVRRVAARRPGA